MKVAILGLGEAGGIIAADLIAAGVTVAGWDPQPKAVPEGVQFAASNAAAAEGADVILSTNWASVATEVALSVRPVLTDRQVYTELNTASPAKKREVAEILRSTGVLFTDGAFMGPLPIRRLGTPVFASGAGAQRFHKLMTPLGMPVTVIDEQPGSAATRKLLRSIIYKGVAAVVIEGLEAGKRLDLEEYVREQIASILGNVAMIDRFAHGSRKHAVRRMHEMEAVAELLAEIGVASHTTDAAIASLKMLREEGI